MRIADLRERSLVVRYLALFGGEVFGKACVLGAFAYLARVLEPGEYGLVEFALSVTVFFVLGVESGMGAFGARVAAAHPDRLPHLVPRIMALRGALGVPTYLVIVGIALARGSAVTGLLAVSGAVVLLTPFLTQWVFQGLRQMQWVAAGSVLRNVVFAGLVVLCVRRGSDLRLVAAAEVAGVAALALLNSYYLYVRLGLRLDLSDLGRGARGLAGQVWALGLSDFTWACLWYSPAIIAGWISPGNTEQVAWIAAAVRLVMALHTFVWLYFFNLLPNLTRELAGGLDPWRGLVRRSMRTAMWPAALVGVGGTVAAPFLMQTVYGPAFAPAVLPLQIVVWMIPVAWFSGHFRFSLIAAGRPQWELAALVVGATVTIAVAGGISATTGSVGAAAALVAGGVANAAAAAWAARWQVGPVPVLRDVAPVAAATLTCVAAGLLATPRIGAVGAAVLACGAFVIAGAWTRRDLVRGARHWFSRA